jgi:hypothetical protein
MKKRTLKIGDYDTATHGWTLTSIDLSAPDQKTNYVEKTGGDGSWDLSTVLTDGLPRYRDRTLTVTLENSQGDREAREKIINEMVNQLDGLEWPIVTPDRPEHYLTGRVHVSVDYSDLAHAAVTITATTAPWLYSAREKIVELEATTSFQTERVRNEGRLAVIPTITVSEYARIRYGDFEVSLETGTHKWSTFLLTPGEHEIQYTGTGHIEIRYREAVLR